MDSHISSFQISTLIRFRVTPERNYWLYRSDYRCQPHSGRYLTFIFKAVKFSVAANMYSLHLTALCQAAYTFCFQFRNFLVNRPPLRITYSTQRIHILQTQIALLSRTGKSRSSRTRIAKLLFRSPKRPETKANKTKNRYAHPIPAITSAIKRKGDKGETKSHHLSSTLCHAGFLSWKIKG